MVDIGKKDVDTLRRLAKQVAELAARPVQQRKRDLWYAHNALQPTRPVIFCDPENGWKEIITQDQMQCENDMARGWEWHLRRELFWGESMGDDRVIEPFLNVPYVSTETDWGMRETRIGGECGGAYTWDSPLKSYEDMGKLRFPEITVDYEATQSILAPANDIFGDILKVRLKAGWWWSLGMTWDLAKLRGLEQIMIDMYDEPEGLHRLMAFLRDCALRKLDFLEENNLLSLNNDGTYVGSGGFGYTDELPRSDFDGKRVHPRDMWGFCESQETVGISAWMFEEFVFQYQLPILERFGLNCYGCCEPLDKRWHVVKKVPRLRRVSVSAWADVSDMAEKLGDRYIFSWKPNPADIALPQIDKDRIRKDMRRAVEITRGRRVEVIMKDNHTIGGNPQNVIDWCRIAREEAERL
ncbi:MAG: hypothetical protein Q7T82_10405 [Armatimonadota bacterium]|nr:hypothetical protein [Armatimonadota bacterium]